MEANGAAGNSSIMSHKICYAWEPFLKVPEKQPGVGPLDRDSEVVVEKPVQNSRTPGEFLEPILIQ